MCQALLEWFFFFFNVFGDPLLSFGRLWAKVLPSIWLIGNARTPYRKYRKVDGEIDCWSANHLHRALCGGQKNRTGFCFLILNRTKQKHVSTEYCKINAFGL